MTNAEKNARARLAARTTVQPLSDWDLTEVLPMTPGRGSLPSLTMADGRLTAKRRTDILEPTGV